jgi:hypothetical protein
VNEADDQTGWSGRRAMNGSDSPEATVLELEDLKLWGSNFAS